MKKFLSLLSLLFIANLGFSQIAISGYMANPGGTDAPYEYVQLIATENIDFSVTPYTVVWLNNGSATANGWVEGGTKSYSFVLSSGTVSLGDVFYVGGDGKLISGSGSTDISSLTWIRAINTGTADGDAFGSKSTSGSLGNGGSNADGIGVFDGVLTTSDNTKKPIDCVFFGTGVGGALSGSNGYPVADNDLYNSSQGLFGEGTNTFLANDPGSNYFVKLTGAYNVGTKTWSTARQSDTIRLDSFSTVAVIASQISITGLPMITVNTSGFTNDFGLTYPNNPSSGSNFIFSGADLTDTLYISTRAPFEIRLGVNAYSSNTIKLAPSAGVINPTVLDARFNPLTTGTYEDTIFFWSAGAAPKYVVVKGNSSVNPEVVFNDATLSVNENVGSVNVRVNIKNANTNSTSFTLTALVSSTATAVLDYTFTSPQTYTFPANSSDSIVVTIPIIDDLLSEGNETLTLSLSSLTNGAVLGKDSVITITIVDNDFRKTNIGDITNTNVNGVLDSLNNMYEITGVVYGGNIRNTTQTGYQFTLIDNTGGVAIYNPTTTTFGYTVAQGDSVTVRGVLGFFNGLAEMTFIDTVIFHKSNATLKQPVKVSVLNENSESDLVRLDNVTVKPGVWTAGNHWIYLSNGDSTEVRVANNVNTLIGVSKPTKKFSIIGIGGQFDATSPYTAGYQLFPRDTNDIIVSADSLSLFNILTLADGATVTIQGASTQTVDFTWETSIPSPGLIPASYEVLFDIPTGDFSAPLKTLQSNVGGTATTLTYPYFQVLDLMAPFGLSVGQSVSLKWTVVATTSNNYKKMADQSHNITFVRGVMNGVNQTANNPLTVYPNPANSSVYVEMPETITNIVINTIEGKQVAAMGNVGTNQTTLPVSNLAAGIYTISVETATGTYTQRLAIQR
jgi:hypothetical protein